MQPSMAIDCAAIIGIMKTVSVRMTDEDHERISRAVAYTGRSLNADMSAAAVLYADLVDLVRLREEAVVAPSARTDDDRAEIERRIKDDFGRVFLAAVPNDAQSVFENAAGVEYPTASFGPIHVPFELLIDWTVNGEL